MEDKMKSIFNDMADEWNEQIKLAFSEVIKNNDIIIPDENIPEEVLNVLMGQMFMQRTLAGIYAMYQTRVDQISSEYNKNAVKHPLNGKVSYVQEDDGEYQ